MNKIYKIVWSKTRNCYVAVSELAKNHGKDSVRSEKRSLVKGMSALALCIALSLGVTGSVWAENQTVEGDLTVKATTDATPAGGNLIVTGKTTTGSLQNADGTIVLGADGSITAGSIDLGTTGIITAGTINANNLILSGPPTLSTYNLNIGNNTVTGDYSAAVGENNIAGGKDSVAIGESSVASGNYSFAGGGNTIRTFAGTGDYYNPIHITEISTTGTQSIASGNQAFAFGYDSKAIGDHSFAFGYKTTAGSSDSMSDNSWNNRYQEDDVPSGEEGGTYLDLNGNKVYNSTPIINGYAAAFGYETAATGSGAFAAGLNTTASGIGAFAAGYKTRAGEGEYGFSGSHYDVNTNPTGSDTTYWRTDYWIMNNSSSTVNLSGKRYATAFGDATTAAGRGSVAFGRGRDFSKNITYNYNDDETYWNQDFAGSPDPGNYYRPDSGRTGAYGDYSAVFGTGTFARSDNAFAIGSHTNAIGTNSFAFGYDTYAVGKDSTAFGNHTMATGNRSTAFGSLTESYGMDSLAFGIDTKAYGKRATAFGSHSLASGDKTTAFGTSTSAQSENATAFGERAQASGKNSVAFGHYSTTGVRYQSEQDKIDGTYTMIAAEGYGNDRSTDTSLSNYYYSTNPIIKVKVEDKQFARVLTDDAQNTIKATKNGKEYIVYHAHTDRVVNYEDAYYKYGNARNTYAIKFREYAEDGTPGDYYYQEVAYDETTGEVTLLDNIVKVGESYGERDLTLTDMGNEDDISRWERNKSPLYQYVMDPEFSARNAVAFGNDTNAQADNSLAFGDASIAGGKRSTAFGNHTVATGDSATAFGDNALASARNATAFGENSRATQQNATTFGQENAALAKNATAWGHKTKATGEASTAYGDGSLAAGKYAASFGEDTVAFAQDSVSWGKNAVAGISTKDADYQTYTGMIKTLVSKEEALKSARKAGDIALTAQLGDEIKAYEGQVQDFYNRHFLTDQSAVDKLNQQTASNLNQQKAYEINKSNLTAVYSNVEIPKYIEKGWYSSIDELVNYVNGFIAYTLNKPVEALTNDEKATAENVASKLVEYDWDSPEYKKQLLADNNYTFMTEENLPDDQKLTADTLPDDQKATVRNMGRNATAWGNTTNAIGLASTAWGKETVAEAENSTAWGYKAIAKGKNSTAWGNQSIAVGGDSTAFGKSSKAWGDNSLAALGGTTGKGSETEDGYTVDTNAVGAAAIGVGAQAQKSYTYAVGNKAKATADNTLAIGNGANATKAAAIAIGTNAVASGEQSISVGYGNQVKGKHSGAFGDPGKLDGDSSYMIGNDNEIAAASTYSFIVGNNVKTTLPKTVVIGHHSDNTNVFGENSVSLGFDAVAQEDDSVALGSKSVASRDITKEGAGYDVLTGRPYDGKDREGKAYKNAVNPKSPIWTPTRGEVAVGDVENNITRRITGVAAGSEDTDAVNVAQLKIATTGFQTHYYSVEIDDPDDPDGLGSNYDNLGATKPGSVAAGYYTSATGFNSTAVGNMTRAEDSNSVAVGHQAHAHSEDSTAVGVDADAYGKGAIAFGHQATSGVLVRITPNMKEGEEGYDPTKVKYEATIIQQTKDNDSYVFRARKEKDENNQPKVAAYNIRTQDYYEAKLNDNGNYDIGNKIEVEESDLDMGGIAMGSFAHSEGDRSLAVGRASGAYGEDSAAIGINSNALGDGGLAIGHGSSVGVQAEVKPSSEKEGEDRANGFWTTEVERDATGNPKANGAIGGIAIGSYAHTEGTRALAVGRVASAYGENSTAMGLRSSAYGEGSMAFGHGVVAGNENEKYAAQVPDLHNNPSMDYDLDGKDGTHVQTSNVIGAVALGSYAEATGRGSLSVGRYSEAQSAYTVAMGIRAEAGEKSENAIAIGREAKVAAGSGDYGGSNSIAMGTLANVKGMNSIAIGTAEFTNKEGTDVLDREKRKGTSVTGNSSIAIGQSDTITGDNSIAIGTGHVIKGSNSGAFGDPNIVNADASYIVGNNSTIDGKDTKTGIDSGPVKDAFILGNDSNVNKSFGVALGSKTTVSAEGGVALGSESVASRDKGNGGAGAGFDVTTGKSYAGKGSDSATWTSTLAAVSVGGDSKDGSIGAAAKATRQITGVAAGTADTDAVNVAQLKLAVGGVTYTAGKNITIDGNVINATGSVYTANQTVEAGGPGEGRTTLNITDGDGGDAGSMTVKAGKNVTITEEKESGKSIAVINATDTTYTVTSEAGDAGTNVVNNYTMTGTNGDKYTFSDTDTTYTADQVVNAGTGWKNDEGGSTTFTITDSSGNNLKPMTIKAGDNVKITKGANGEAVIQGNGLKNDENPVVYDEKTGEGSVTITDQAGNTTKITNIRSLGGEGIADSINYLGDRINNLDKKINKVGAGAAALAGLHPLDFDPDEKWDFSAAAGSYKGEHAVAIGAFYRPNEDTMFSVGGTIGNGNNMVNVGVSWKFGQKNRISANRISSAKEIIELRKNQEDVHSFLADAVAGNQLDLSKIQLFPDVEENHWAYDYVATMAGNGVLEGYPDGYFKGNRNMTRYEMAAVLYRLMQNGARLSDRALTEFAPELDRIRVDTITKHKDGTPHIQRVRTIKERVDEKADPSSEKTAKKKAKVKVAEKPVE